VAKWASTFTFARSICGFPTASTFSSRALRLFLPGATFSISSSPRLHQEETNLKALLENVLAVGKPQMGPCECEGGAHFATMCLSFGGPRVVKAGTDEPDPQRPSRPCLEAAG